MQGRGIVGGAAAGLLAVVVLGAGCLDLDGQDDGTWTSTSGSRVLRMAVRSDPVSVPAGETLAGDLVVIGGAASVDGEVRGDLVVIAGNLRVGPSAVIGGDLIAVGNEATDVAAGARIAHSQIAVNFPGVRWLVENALYIWDNPLLVVLVALLGTALLLYLLYRVLIRRYDAERFHGTVEFHPVRAGLIGLIVHIAFGALTLGAFASRWGMGLVGPLVLGGFALGAIGWTMCAVHFGRMMARRRGWKVGPFGYGLAGFGIVGLLSLIPILGQFGAYLLSLVGVGALISPSKPDELARASGASAVPPAPSAPAAPSVPSVPPLASDEAATDDFIPEIEPEPPDQAPRR